jgi:hypothetical protein
MRRTAVLCLVVLTLTGAIPAPSQSQVLQHVTVALVETLADSTALATIIRSPAPTNHTMVMIRERDATPEMLASAMVALFDSRRTYGDEPTMEIVINLRGHKRAESLTPNERKQAELYLARLRNAQFDDVSGIGRARTTTIALAPVERPRSK